MVKKILVALWVCIAVVMLGLTSLFVAISQGWIGYLPDTSELENPNYKFASQVLSADGREMGTWSYSKENRVFVDYKDLSPYQFHLLRIYFHKSCMFTFKTKFILSSPLE